MAQKSIRIKIELITPLGQEILTDHRDEGDKDF